MSGILQTQWRLECLACGAAWTVTTNGVADRTCAEHWKTCEGTIAEGFTGTEDTMTDDEMEQLRDDVKALAILLIATRNHTGHLDSAGTIPAWKHVVEMSRR